MQQESSFYEFCLELLDISLSLRPYSKIDLSEFSLISFNVFCPLFFELYGGDVHIFSFFIVLGAFRKKKSKNPY